MRYEILDNTGEVINTIIANQEFVEEHHANFYRLVPEPPEPKRPNIILKLSFRLRFTDLEFTQIISASKIDAEVQMWYDTFNMLSVVDLDNQRVKDGMASLVDKKLLTQDRANEILTAPVQQGERP